MTNVEHDVNVVFVFKISIEAHNVLVMQRSVDLDLACQFLPRFASCQVGFANDFQGPAFISIGFSWTDARYFVCSSKSAFPKEASFLVQIDLRNLIIFLSLCWLHSFFNNLKMINWIAYIRARALISA